MEDKNFFIPYESAVASLERTIKRLWVLCIIMIVLFVGTNAFWIWNNSKYYKIVTETEITQDFDTGESGNIENGDININGESKTDR